MPFYAIPVQAPAVAAAASPDTAARLLPMVGGGTVPEALTRLMSVPDEYQYGACQAMDYVAYQAGFTFISDSCGQFNRADALPASVGVGRALRTGYDWLSILAAQLPAGVGVVIDESIHAVILTRTGSE